MRHLVVILCIKLEHFFLLLIAIKRMSEILIYKANECTAKLDEATEIVNAEIHRFVCYDCLILKILFLRVL